jgi:hypothetical protein
MLMYFKKKNKETRVPSSQDSTIFYDVLGHIESFQHRGV